MGVDISGQDAQKGGLARPVGPDQRETLLRLKIPAYRVQEVPVPDGVMEVTNLKHNLSSMDNHNTIFSARSNPQSHSFIVISLMLLVEHHNFVMLVSKSLKADKE